MDRRDWSTPAIAVANLVLTAVIGIGVALYLRAQDESLSLRLAEINQRSRYASVTLTCEGRYGAPACSGLKIANLGPAEAQKIKLVLVLDALRFRWDQVITSVTDFAFMTFPPTVSVDRVNRRVELPATERRSAEWSSVPAEWLPSGFRENAIEFTIPALPPGGFVQIEARTPRFGDGDRARTEVKVARLGSVQSFDEGALALEIERMLYLRAVIGDFATFLTCTNCVGDVQRLAFSPSTYSGYWWKPADGSWWLEGGAALHAETYLPRGLGDTPRDGLRVTYHVEAGAPKIDRVDRYDPP